MPEGYLDYNPNVPMAKCPACAGPMVRKPPAVCIRCERKGIEAPALTASKPHVWRNVQNDNCGWCGVARTPEAEDQPCPNRTEDPW